MPEQHVPDPGSAPPRDDRVNAQLLIGGLLIMLGMWLLARIWLVGTPLWSYLVQAQKAAGAIALIVIGAIVIYFSAEHRRPSLPARGTKLYRAPRDAMLGGVLAGLARYLGVDVSILRVAYVALTLLTGVWLGFWLYVIAWVLVPAEPLRPSEPPTYTQPPYPPQQPMGG